MGIAVWRVVCPKIGWMSIFAQKMCAYPRNSGLVVTCRESMACPQTPKASRPPFQALAPPVRLVGPRFIGAPPGLGFTASPPLLSAQAAVIVVFRILAVAATMPQDYQSWPSSWCEEDVHTLAAAYSFRRSKGDPPTCEDTTDKRPPGS